MPMTPKIRESFIQRFYPDIDQTEFDRLMGMSAQDLLDEYDMTLSAAQHRWPSLDTGAEWAEMDRWLSERGVAAGSRSL